MSSWRLTWLNFPGEKKEEVTKQSNKNICSLPEWVSLCTRRDTPIEAGK